MSKVATFAIEMTAAFAALATLVGCSPGQPGGSATTSALPKPPPAKLDGLYRIVSDKTMTENEVSQDDPHKFDERWVFRSGCTDICTATAKKVADDAQLRVFDYINGSWTTTADVPDGADCTPNKQQFLSVLWTIWSLQPRPDGSLTGTLTNVGTDACQWIKKYSVTLTRIGDAPPNANLPDPAAQPKRGSSVAQQLWGKYTKTATVRDAQTPPLITNFQVTTDCLRNGELCVTYMVGGRGPNNGPLQFASYVFGHGKWLQSGVQVSQDCGPGVRDSSYSPPAPPVPNPITTLTGEAHITYTGSCPPNKFEDYQLQRTGD